MGFVVSHPFCRKDGAPKFSGWNYFSRHSDHMPAGLPPYHLEWQGGDPSGQRRFFNDVCCIGCADS